MHRDLSNAIHTVSARDFQRQPGRFHRMALSEPVLVTAHGEPSLVVMSFREYRRLVEQGRVARPVSAELSRTLEGLRRIGPQLGARGVEHAGVFGSVARGEAGVDSDIDVVVTPADGYRFDLVGLGAIQELLELTFPGRRVDLVAEPVVRPELQDALRRDRINAF